MHTKKWLAMRGKKANRHTQIMASKKRTLYTTKKGLSANSELTGLPDF